VQHHPVVLVSH